jgi:5-hydroxyisourate hydrolase-like protein (transthyretin family)
MMRAVQIVSVVLAAGALLAACTMNPNSKTYTDVLTGSANPIGVQTGRLTVIVLDAADGGPLQRSTVDVVAADANAQEPTYFRRAGVADRNGKVTFADVPQRVNVSITHERGTYSLDNHVVPPGRDSEFRVYVDTVGLRSQQDCLTFQHCRP